MLLGDAAHAMASNLGQGANSALVDGVVLAEELSRGSVADALARYGMLSACVTSSKSRPLA